MAQELGPSFPSQVQTVSLFLMSFWKVKHITSKLLPKGILVLSDDFLHTIYKCNNYSIFEYKVYMLIVALMILID